MTFLDLVVERERVVRVVVQREGLRMSIRGDGFGDRVLGVSRGVPMRRIGFRILFSYFVEHKMTSETYVGRLDCAARKMTSALWAAHR